MCRCALIVTGDCLLKRKEKENGDCPSLQMVLSNAHLYTASLMTYES